MHQVQTCMKTMIVLHISVIGVHVRILGLFFNVNSKLMTCKVFQSIAEGQFWITKFLAISRVCEILRLNLFDTTSPFLYFTQKLVNCVGVCALKLSSSLWV